MRRLLILSLAWRLVCFWGAPILAVTPEAQPKVITSASKNLVEIGLSYAGDKIFFFGVNPVPGSDRSRLSSLRKRGSPQAFRQGQVRSSLDERQAVRSYRRPVHL